MNDIDRARAYIAKVPGAIEGQGGDKLTFSLACKLKELFNLTGNDALRIMLEWNPTCRPPWREQELARKIRSAGLPCTSAGADYGFSRWPKVDERAVAKACQNGITLERLEEMNPCQPDGDEPHAGLYVDALFPGNPLLCCAPDTFNAATEPREFWRGKESSLAYIVPSGMSAKFGETKEGKPSQRTLTNVGPRDYIVVEFDKDSAGVDRPVDDQAAILFHLAQYAPLVLALHSGGKSIHGWFRAQGVEPETVTKFFRYAVSLGADDQIHCPMQLVRMPDGTRENGKRQRVLFFNPKGVLPK